MRYRRPYAEGYRLNYGFDHNGGGGCTDYACGGACYDGHTGNDFGAPYGTTVLAAADGVVSATNDGCADYGSFGNTCGGRCGNYVQIRHSDGSYSLYCHMRRGSLRVGTGARVSCGQPLGQSASSGSSTGPHLHFGHRSPGSGSSSDPFAGGCSRATTLWTAQGGYRDPPGTSCMCSASGESCNGADDDCDGRVDEGLSRRCGTDVGECVAGTQTCAGGGWGACRGEVPPRAEDCNGRDDDCDGGTDEALVRSCGTDVGECVAGTELCAGGAWAACEGAIDPVPEVCDRLDNDCDGQDDDERICEREEVAYTAPLLPRHSTDVDGDGRADACARIGDRLRCLVAGEHGFGEEIVGPSLDAGADLFRAASVRVADLDRDGLSDACARVDDRLTCWRSDGRGFAEAIVGPLWIEGASLELADVDGDGLLDACLRDADGLACHLGTARGWGGVVLLPALSDEAGFADPIHHGSLRFGDVNGDGRDDACARGPDGVDCWLSEGDHFGATLRGPRWSDVLGFDRLPYWSTLRLADADGDGADDVCARTPEGFRCAIVRGDRVAETIAGPRMADEEGWDRADVYSTLRMGDVDGDGRADVCARRPDGIRCWRSSGRAFDLMLLGPALTDADGWTEPARFRSIRLADVDRDGRDDLCARHGDGLRCTLATGHGFEQTWIAPSWSDASSALDAPAATATIRIGGGASSSPPSQLDGSCACRAGVGRSERPPLAWLLALALVVLRRRGR